MEPTPHTLTTLEALYDACGEAIYRYALGMLGRRQDAEDAVQTLWLQLARSRLDRVRDRQAYVWKAARRLVARALRRRAVERRRGADWAEAEMLPAAENPGVSRDRLRDVENAVLGLPPKQRAIVVLVGFEGLTLKEASGRLGIPAGTAASRFRAAVAKLRRRLRT